MERIGEGVWSGIGFGFGAVSGVVFTAIVVSLVSSLVGILETALGATLVTAAGSLWASGGFSVFACAAIGAAAGVELTARAAAISALCARACDVLCAPLRNKPNGGTKLDTTKRGPAERGPAERALVERGPIVYEIPARGAAARGMPQCGPRGCVVVGEAFAGTKHGLQEDTAFTVAHDDPKSMIYGAATGAAVHRAMEKGDQAQIEAPPGQSKADPRFGLKSDSIDVMDIKDISKIFSAQAVSGREDEITGVVDSADPVDHAVAAEAVVVVKDDGQADSWPLGH